MRATWLVVLLSCGVAAPVANAIIVDATAAAGDTEKLTLTGTSWDTGSQTFSLSEKVRGLPATVSGDFIADSPLDPKVWVRKSVENDTTFGWAGYHISVVMPQDFSVIQTSAPTNWTAIPSSTWQISATEWEATIDYMPGPGGAAIEIGEYGDFGFQVQFDGSTHFLIDQVPVAPEPASLLLLALGGLLLRRSRR